MGSIKIVPFGKISEDVLSAIGKELRAIYNLIPDILPPSSLPGKFYNYLRRQILAGEVLEFLGRFKGKTLGVIDEDLYAEGLNFVFGQAQFAGNVAIISIARLNPSFYGQPSDKNLLVTRAIKEAVHEVGHLYGLEHCENEKCVMNFSNTIFNVDRKTKNLCERCKLKITIQ